MAGMAKPQIRALALDDPRLKVRVSLQTYEPKSRAYKFAAARSARFALRRSGDADLIWREIVALLRQLHEHPPEEDDRDRPPRPRGDGSMAHRSDPAVVPTT